MKRNNSYKSLIVMSLIFSAVQCLASETSFNKSQTQNNNYQSQSDKKPFGITIEQKNDPHKKLTSEFGNLRIMTDEDEEPVVATEENKSTEKTSKCEVDTKNQKLPGQPKCKTCENTEEIPLGLFDDDLIREIISHLPDIDIAHFSRTSHRIKDLAQPILKKHYENNYITINLYNECPPLYYIRIRKSQSLNEIIWQGVLSGTGTMNIDDLLHFQTASIKLPIDSLRFRIARAVKIKDKTFVPSENYTDYIYLSKEDLESLKKLKITYLYINEMFQPYRSVFQGYVDRKPMFDKPLWEKEYLLEK